MKQKESRDMLEEMNPSLRFRTSEWSEGERNEPKRNGEVRNRRAELAMDRSPDCEVVAHPKRRRFTAAYKAQIVRETAACTQPGQIGSLLRREGLYSSQLAAWRLRFQRGEEEALQECKRGRKPKQTALEKENAHLRQQIQRMEKQLIQAKLLIDLQKKMAEIMSATPAESNENN